MSNFTSQTVPSCFSSPNLSVDDIRKCINNGFDIRGKFYIGETIFDHVLNRPFLHQAEVITELLHLGAYVNEGSGAIRDTPLHLAAAYIPAQHEVIRILLEHGADPNAFNSMKNTPLHYLMHINKQYKSFKSFELLLQYGANVNLRNEDMETPLHVALDEKYALQTLSDQCGQKPSPRTIELLLRHGSDVNAFTMNRYTPLRMASVCRMPTSIVQLLLEYGARVSYSSDVYHFYKYSKDIKVDLLVEKYRLLEQFKDQNEPDHEEWEWKLNKCVTDEYTKKMLFYRCYFGIYLTRMGQDFLFPNLSVRDFVFKFRFTLPAYAVSIYQNLYEFLIELRYNVYDEIVLKEIENSKKSIWCNILLQIRDKLETSKYSMGINVKWLFLRDGNIMSQFLTSKCLFHLIVALDTALNQRCVLREI